MAIEVFKLPKSSYEELCKIIIAYKEAKDETSLDVLSQYSGMAKSVISRNNAFLSSLDIIEGGNKKKITDMGNGLAQALQHEVEEEIMAHWFKIINENEFMTKMSKAIQIRQKMDLDSFVNHIAYSSGEKKSFGVSTGSRAVIEIFKRAGVAKLEDGVIYPISIKMQTISEEENKKDDELITQDILLKNRRVHKSSNVVFNIEFRVSLGTEDLKSLSVLLCK